MGNAAAKEIGVEVLAAAGKTPGNDLGKRVVDGATEEAVLAVLEGNHIAGGGFAEGFENFTGVNPVVAVEEAGAGTNDEAGHGERMKDEG